MYNVGAPVINPTFDSTKIVKFYDEDGNFLGSSYDVAMMGQSKLNTVASKSYRNSGDLMKALTGAGLPYLRGEGIKFKNSREGMVDPNPRNALSRAMYEATDNATQPIPSRRSLASSPVNNAPTFGLPMVGQEEEEQIPGMAMGGAVANFLPKPKGFGGSLPRFDQDMPQPAAVGARYALGGPVDFVQNSATRSQFGTNEGLAGFMQGGPVNGPGTGTSDSILARVSKGEYILPKAAVDMIGRDTLDAIRQEALRRSGVEPKAAAPRDRKGLPMYAQGTPQGWEQYVNQGTLTAEQLRQLQEGIKSSAQAAGRSPALEMARRTMLPTEPAPAPAPISAGKIASGLAGAAVPTLAGKFASQVQAIEYPRVSDSDMLYLAESDPGFYAQNKENIDRLISAGKPTPISHGLGQVLRNTSDIAAMPVTIAKEFAGRNLERGAEALGNIYRGATGQAPIYLDKPSKDTRQPLSVRRVGGDIHEATSLSNYPYTFHNEAQLADTMVNSRRLVASPDDPRLQAIQDDLLAKKGLPPVGPLSITRADRTAVYEPSGARYAPAGQPSLDQRIADAMDLAMNGQNARSWQGLKVWDTRDNNAAQRQAQAQGLAALKMLEPYYQGQPERDMRTMEQGLVRQMLSAQPDSEEQKNALTNLVNIRGGKPAAAYESMVVPKFNDVGMQTGADVVGFNKNTGRVVSPQPSSSQIQKALAIIMKGDKAEIEMARIDWDAKFPDFPFSRFVASQSGKQ